MHLLFYDINNVIYIMNLEMSISNFDNNNGGLNFIQIQKDKKIMKI